MGGNFNIIVTSLATVHIRRQCSTNKVAIVGNLRAMCLNIHARGLISNILDMIIMHEVGLC